MLHAHAAGENIYSAEVGAVVMRNNNHTFEYSSAESEDDDIPWPSMSCNKLLPRAHAQGVK